MFFLQLNEDLENYYQRKFKNSKPKLKSSATLRYLENIPSNAGTSTENKSASVEVK